MCFISLLSIVFNKLLPGSFDRLFDKYYYTVIPVYCAPLIVHIIIGFYSKFYADDYCSAAKAQLLGVLKAAHYWYMNWTGRFSANLFDAIMGKLGPITSPYSTLFIMLIWIGILISVIFFIIDRERGKHEVLFISLLLSLIIIYTTLEVTPTVTQSLYWGQGMHSVVPPLILGTLLLGMYKPFVIKRKANIFK